MIHASSIVINIQQEDLKSIAHKIKEGMYEKICREEMEEIEWVMENTPGIGRAEDFDMEHHFANGLYIRVCRIPAGSLAMSRFHLDQHVFFLTQGDMTFASELGTQRIIAPYNGIHAPGYKKLVYVHEDIVAITVHRSDKTTVEDVEAELFANTFQDWDKLQEALS